MQVVPTSNQDASSSPPSAPRESLTSDLKFISELGRSLLFTAHPKKVASRVSEALWERLGAKVCGFAVGLENVGLIASTCSRTGESDAAFDKQHLEKWLGFLPPQIGYHEIEPNEFLIATRDHTSEYLSPLHINGEIRGAIVVGLDSELS